MTPSQNLAFGEIAYDGFHAIDDEYKKFEKLSPALQERWAQGARNVCDAWLTGADVEMMRVSTRMAHDALRAKARTKDRVKHKYYCWAADFFEPNEGAEIEAINDGFAACDYARVLYGDPSFCDVCDKILIHVRDSAGVVTRLEVHCVIHAEDAPPGDEPDVTK